MSWTRDPAGVGRPETAGARQPRPLPADSAGLVSVDSASDQARQVGGPTEVRAGLRIVDATVRYGAVAAVDRLTLEVAPGEIVALLGASGSGKSSLLRAVAGLEPLASGKVLWDGVDLAQTPVHQRGFVMMFQDGQLFPHLSVAGNVGYALHRLGKVERRTRVEELLELVDLAGYGPRPVSALSGGQAQRVALARSLAPRPRLLMLDEPLSALDRTMRERLAGVLEQTMRVTGTPGLYVTHDQDEAFAVADRVAVLAQGRLLQCASPLELWSRPSSREVAAFLGYRPFLLVPQAAALGWAAAPGGESADAVVVAVGPDGLVEDPDGTPVAVTSVRPGRGVCEVGVRLPDGADAVVRTRAEPGLRVSVRLRPQGCALIRASS